ncbi:MAG: hypothetical protein EOP06_27230, partial [Proteobacteria bacterium]
MIASTVLCRLALPRVDSIHRAWDKWNMISNSTKVWTFILISSLVLLMIGYEIGERLGLLIGFLIAVGLNFFVFFYGESQILKSLQAEEVRGQDPWGLGPMTDNLCNLSGTSPPRIFVFPSSHQTAFCLTQLWKRGCLVLSSGLLQKFSKEDLEAVIAYQIATLGRMDTFLF